MKLILAFLFALIAMTIALPAQQEDFGFNDKKRTFDTPTVEESVAKDYLLVQGKGIVYNIASSVRFTTHGAFDLGILNDIVGARLFSNGFNIINDQLIDKEKLPIFTLAVGLLAHNPVTQYLARVPLLNSQNFYLTINDTDFDFQCSRIPSGSRIVAVDNTYCHNDDATTTRIVINLKDILNATDDGVLHRNFVYRLIDVLVDIQGINATNPLTGEQSSTSATNAYRACYNKLYLNGLAPAASPSFPTYSGVGDDDPSSCAVDFVMRGHRICYSNGASFSFQQDVPANKRVDDNSTEYTNAKCGQYRTQDGYCGGSGDTCGYIQCLLDNKYCDYSACFKVQPNTGKVCCNLFNNAGSYYLCPPDNNPTFATCFGNTDPALTQCCTDSTGSNCVAAQAEEVGSCFIATAAFGSSMDPNVWTLRLFRDNYLLTNPLGRAFVQFYYSVSPQIANFIAQSEGLKAVTRALLTPLVTVVSLF